MGHWLRNLFARSGAGPAAVEERVLLLEGETQRLRLDLAERERLLMQLRHELERQRRSEGERIAAAMRTHTEEWLREAAGPVVQLQMQTHLLEQGQAVAAREILAVAQRLLRVLEKEGLTLEETVGRVVPFDPCRHEPLSNDTALIERQRVVVRFVGVAFRGKMLRKVGIERAEE